MADGTAGIHDRARLHLLQVEGWRRPEVDVLVVAPSGYYVGIHYGQIHRSTNDSVRSV